MRDIFEYKNNFEKCSEIKSVLLYGCDSDNVPDVTIIIPTFKRPDYLRNSLLSAIGQDYKGSYEIVVVDNDDTEYEGTSPNQRVIEEINSSKVNYYRNQKNIGMFGNWNRGIEIAKAPFITFCHDDDELLPTALTTLMECNKTAKGKLILSKFHNMDEAGNITYEFKPRTKTKMFGLLKPKNLYTCTKWDQFISSYGFGCGCLFKKEHLISIGGYSEEFYPSADYALQALYTFKYGAYINEIPTFKYRIAANESLTVYDTFAEVDKHFRTCMKPYLRVPNFILDRIILANYRTSKLHFKVQWGKYDKSILSNIKSSDKYIMSLIKKIYTLKTYRF